MKIKSSEPSDSAECGEETMTMCCGMLAVCSAFTEGDVEVECSCLPAVDTCEMCKGSMSGGGTLTKESTEEGWCHKERVR